LIAAELPPTAAWRHLDAREGFEVVFMRAETDGYRFDGHATAVEDGVTWSVRYEIATDLSWVTRSARVSCRTAAGRRDIALEADGDGGWLIDGTPAGHVAGCLDLDLEASAFTNTFPIQRLQLSVGDTAEAPAAYVRGADLELERLEQRYTRMADVEESRRYDYVAPDLGFRAQLVYDKVGLVVDYPGIGVRVI
jgi:uncharacterized protein